ncbi:glycosyltransferase [uncultured Pseudokineococcus sp.]|uniref:glycosyltransferase n=1 Tax=uncultured Pseudokineococcus sp. TaxID=1642928 RepID=UPI00261F4D47|nr:glycosyltransferase [uncultured Pseudokineococcus sp.]
MTGTAPAPRAPGEAPGPPSVLVVGAGWMFTSGISYYTCRLANALSTRATTSALLMRRLVPRALYPGRARVGTRVNDLDYVPEVDVLDGLDWFWGASALRAARFVGRRSPDVVVLQWWTGAVLHSYVMLALLARRRGARVVMEWHEVQDTGEARIPGVARYVRFAMKALLRMVDAHVVHSEYDLDLLVRAYHLDRADATLVAHGPYDHVGTGPAAPAGEIPSPGEGSRTSTVEDPFTLLYFGVIRPYKGVEDLVAAFEGLPDEVGRRVRLLVVGETWEGWTAPLEAIGRSPVRDRIDVVNRYVTDAEVSEVFARADGVVLPYRRSSSSGPLHIAMSSGLPVVVSAVGGLVEAAGDYEGVRFAPPGDVDALRSALVELVDRRGERYADPHSWSRTVERYGRVLTSVGVSSWDQGPA